MLPKPLQIETARIADTSPRFPWDEWHVENAYQPADPELMKRMAALSHRANVAISVSIAEWIVWRFEKLSNDPAPYQFLEAAWASVVHTAYARYVEFNDDDWRGVVRGSQRMAMEILIDLMWGLHDTVPGQNAAWMSKLAELVLADPAPFLEWRDQCIERLEKHYPRPDDSDAVFSDEIDAGPWVPRELFDASKPFDPAQTRGLIQKFVKTLDYRQNPFLNEPDEMQEFEDYSGTPYKVIDSDQ